MSRSLISTILIICSLSEAASESAHAKCHIYSYWAFPWPQKCGVLHKNKVSTHEARFVPSEQSQIEFIMPLPTLTDLETMDWSHSADKRFETIAKLRELGNVSPSR